MRSQQLFIPSVFPGLNNIIAISKKHWGAYSTLKKESTQRVAWLIHAAGIWPFDSVFIEFVWYEKNRRRDPDNLVVFGRKCILDALVDMQIIKNDGWNQILGWTDDFEVRPKYPGVLITLWPDKPMRDKGKC